MTLIIASRCELTQNQQCHFATATWTRRANPTLWLTWSAFCITIGPIVTLTYLPLADGRCCTLLGLTPTALSTTPTMLATKSSPPDPMALKLRSVGYKFTYQTRALQRERLVRSSGDPIF